jgi:hypothetical protein
MRRILFVLIVAGLGALVPALAAGAGPSVPPTSFQKTPVGVTEAGDQSKAPEVPADTNTVGVQWSGDASAKFLIETKSDTGKWKAADTVTAPDGGADPGSAEALAAQKRIGAQFASEPVGVNDPAKVRVRVTSGHVNNVRIVAVASPPGFANTDPAPTPLDVNPLAAGGLAFAAAGAVSTRKGRRGGLLLVLIVGMAASAALIGVPNANAAAPGDVPFPPNPGFVSRAQWGADENLRLAACPDGPDYATPKVVVIHHTATTNSYSPQQTAATVRGIYVYYIQGRGYCDHGYNFLVDRYGIIYEGRYGGAERGVIGAHATNFNTGTIGIAMIGDNTSVSPTPQTFNALVKLIAWKMSIHQMNPFYPVAFRGAIINPIIGHRDAGRISGDGTSCPGQAGYNILPRLITTVRPLVAFGYPLGTLEVARRQPNAIQVSGWTADPDTSASTQVHVYVDGRGVGVTTANIRRTDVGQAYPWLGDNRGFKTSVPVSQAPHTVCVYAISVGNGGNRQLGCANLSGNTVGHLDSATRRPGTVALRGWTVDPDTTASVPIHVYSDGIPVLVGVANTDRPDIGNAYPEYGNAHGFNVEVPAVGDHTVCAYAISTGGKPNITLGCTRTSGAPRGSFDAATRPGGVLRVRGWAFDPDTDNPIDVHVYVDGVGRAAHAADTLRADVGQIFGPWSDQHGFDFAVGPLAAGPHQVCVYAISFGGGANSTLGCKTIA